MAQLKKHCPACKAKDLHSRASECSHCGFTFYIKRNSDVSADWATLEIGSTVKSVRGAGPYAVVRKINEDPYRVSFGTFGTFVIKEITEDGLWVRELKAMAFGSKAIPSGITGREHFIYMAKERMGATGVVRQSPHKILFQMDRVNTNKRVSRGRG